MGNSNIQNRSARKLEYPDECGDSNNKFTNLSQKLIMDTGSLQNKYFHVNSIIMSQEPESNTPKFKNSKSEI